MTTTNPTKTIEFDLGNGFAVKRTKALKTAELRQGGNLVDQVINHHWIWADLAAEALIAIYNARHNPAGIALLVEHAMWANSAQVEDLQSGRAIIHEVVATAAQEAAQAAAKPTSNSATKRLTQTKRRAA